LTALGVVEAASSSGVGFANASHIRPEKAEQTLCLFYFFLFEFHDDELRKCGTHLLVLRSTKLCFTNNYRRKTKFVSLSIRPEKALKTLSFRGFFLFYEL